MKQFKRDLAEDGMNIEDFDNAFKEKVPETRKQEMEPKKKLPDPESKKSKEVAPDGTKTKRFQYTAIDDATRIRALQVYKKHTQKNAIHFIDHVIEKFPFRIQTVRTDNGHEFQAKFHWHVEDLGMRHAYIKPGTPRLNGKVERSHKTDQQEFYQLLEYSGDVDLKKKLKTWEEFYNFDRPHGAFAGKTPYEALKEKLNQ